MSQPKLAQRVAVHTCGPLEMVTLPADSVEAAVKRRDSVKYTIHMSQGEQSKRFGPAYFRLPVLAITVA